MTTSGIMPSADLLDGTNLDLSGTPFDYETPHDVAEAARNAAVLNDPRASAPAPASGSFEYGLASGSLLSAGDFCLDSADILAWTAQHARALNGQLRNLMNDADARTKVVGDLAHIKAMLTESAVVADVKSETQAMLEAYAGTPYESEVREMLEPVLSATADDALSTDELTTTTNELQGTIDKLQKQDEIGMIYIQDLCSRVRQAIQSGSNMISGIDQTSMAIVANIGR